MNSHQSLAEALEMCKYTENFTSRVGGGGGGRGAEAAVTLPDPRKPTRQQPNTLVHVQ